MNKELEIEELKKIELDILCFIDDVCQKNNINYSLAGGTLLGAVRHKGFIPWDDDIDILMVRDQYEKFMDIMSNLNDEKYSLISFKNNEDYGNLFSKVVDKTTTIVEEYAKAVKGMGVYVDIFPVDNLGNSKEEANKNLSKIKFKKYLGVAWNWKHFYINKSRGFFRQIPRFIFFVLSRFHNIKKDCSKIEKRFVNCSDEFMGSICGVYGNKEIMPKKVFDNYTLLDFENRQFKVIEGYKDYLTSLYGDYMKLPPVEKRVTHHTFKAYLIEK